MQQTPKVALLALLAASALFGQKTHPGVTALAEPGARLQVLVVLRHQPQPEIVQRVEGAAALRTGILEGDWLKLSGQRYASAEQLRETRGRLDAAVMETRQAALREIRDATVLEQQAVQSRLTGLGASSVHGYAVLNAVAAEVPAEALAALEADPEVAEIVPVEWHEGLLDVSPAALGAPAYWSRGITGAGEAVAVLDSGVRTSHPTFAGMNIVGRVFGRYASQSNCFADNAQSAEDMNGHGSHVAGIVAGQGAPGAPYVGVARGLGTLYNLKIGFHQKDIQGQCGGQGFLEHRRCAGGARVGAVQHAREGLQLQLRRDGAIGRRADRARLRLPRRRLWRDVRRGGRQRRARLLHPELARHRLQRHHGRQLRRPRHHRPRRRPGGAFEQPRAGERRPL